MSFSSGLESLHESFERRCLLCHNKHQQHRSSVPAAWIVSLFTPRFARSSGIPRRRSLSVRRWVMPAARSISCIFRVKVEVVVVVIIWLSPFWRILVAASPGKEPTCEPKVSHRKKRFSFSPCCLCFLLIRNIDVA